MVNLFYHHSLNILEHFSRLNLTFLVQYGLFNLECKSILHRVQLPLDFHVDISKEFVKLLFGRLFMFIKHVVEFIYPTDWHIVFRQVLL